jgi:hypothetical protein
MDLYGVLRCAKGAISSPLGDAWDLRYLAQPIRDLDTFLRRPSGPDGGQEQSPSSDAIGAQMHFPLIRILQQQVLCTLAICFRQEARRASALGSAFSTSPSVYGQQAAVCGDDSSRLEGGYELRLRHQRLRRRELHASPRHRVDTDHKRHRW